MKKLFSAYRHAMDWLYSAIRACIAVILVIMVAVTALEVFRRYIMGLSFIWAEELVKFLLVATTFMGGAAAYRAKALACLDLVTSHFKPNVQKAVDLVSTVVIILVCLYLCIQGYAYAFTPQVAMMYSMGLKLKMTYIYLTIPIGFTLLILFAVEHFFVVILSKETVSLSEREKEA